MPSSRWLNVAFSCVMDVFHRVFQRDDVDGLGAVDLVEDGGQGGGFAGTGRAGDEHQAGLFLGDLLEDVRELQLFQRRNVGVQLAADDGIIAALREDVDAEAGLVRKRVGRVAGTVAQQIFDVPEIVADDIQGDRSRSGRA